MNGDKPPEWFQKQIFDAMKRMGDRLVETGFARGFVTSTGAGRGALVLTDSGIALQASLQKVFDVPNCAPEKLTTVDFTALFMLLLIAKPN
jgi:hypothetical protein